MLRVVEDVVGLAELHKVALVHHGHTIRQVAHHRQIVCDEQVGQAKLALERIQQVDHAGLDGHVEGRYRLVEHDHRRVRGQRTRQADALTLTTREVAREAVQLLLIQTHRAHELGDTGILVALVAQRIQRLLDDLLDRHTRVQRAHRILEHHLNIAACLTTIRRTHLRRVLATDHDAGITLWIQAHDL